MKSAILKFEDDILRAVEPFNDLMRKLEPLVEAKRDLGSLLQILEDMKIVKHEVGPPEGMKIELAAIKRDIEDLSRIKGDVHRLTRQADILTRYAELWTKAEADKREKKADLAWDVVSSSSARYFVALSC